VGRSHFFHLEMATKPLKLLGRVLTDYPKCGLKSLDNQADFDSAIQRFESSRPSHAYPPIYGLRVTRRRSPHSAHLCGRGDGRPWNRAGHGDFLCPVSNADFPISEFAGAAAETGSRSSCDGTTDGDGRGRPTRFARAWDFVALFGLLGVGSDDAEPPLFLLGPG
jgi:hypothetical protein